MKHDLAGLRTGRANTSLLDPVTVEVYGAACRSSQVGDRVGAGAADMLSVQVWDKSQRHAGRKGDPRGGPRPQPDHRRPDAAPADPRLTEERRKELAKLAGQYAEKAKIAVRNVRRDGMEALKTDEKKGKISQDEQKRLAKPKSRR